MLEVVLESGPDRPFLASADDADQWAGEPCRSGQRDGPVPGEEGSRGGRVALDVPFDRRAGHDAEGADAVRPSKIVYSMLTGRGVPRESTVAAKRVPFPIGPSLVLVAVVI